MTPKQEKQRLDLALVERGLAETRARAQAIILGGGITVDGTIVTKPAAVTAPDSSIELVAQPMPYASRGGLKLRHALDHFSVDAAGRVAVDVGASTGGFTDVLLEANVARVYAIDVGYGQLAWRLRTDPRVVVMDRTNIRNVDSLPEPADLATIDVSFISLVQVLPHVARLLQLNSDVVALVKPQFEAGREQVGRKGVVRDPRIWHDVLIRVSDFAQATGWAVRGLERSPIRGPAGNVEYLIHLSRDPSLTSIAVESVVDQVIDVDRTKLSSP